MKHVMSYKSAILFLCVVLFSWQGKSQSVEKLYAQANQSYKSHQYEQAIESYNKVLQLGYENSDLHYNLGNTYFRLNQIGSAILHYEKALKMNPSNQDAAFNLKIANLKVMSKIKPVEEFILVRWTRSMLHVFSFDTWATIQIGLGFLALLTFVLYLFVEKGSTKRISFYAGVVLLLMMSLSWIMAWGAKSDLQNSEYGVVLSSAAPIKSEPTDNSKELTTLREGIKFKRLEIVGKWHQIKLSDGTLGWIHEENFQMI